VSPVIRYALVVAVLLFAFVRLSRRRAGARPPRTRSVRELPWQGDVALVAEREVRERTRSRMFRVGTLVILLAVAAAIVIPQLSSSSSSKEKVGLVGTQSPAVRAAIVALGPPLGTTVVLRPERDRATAERDLNAGRVDVVLFDTDRVLVKTALKEGDSSTTAQLASALAHTVSLQVALQTAALSPQQVKTLTNPVPLAVGGLHPAPSADRNRTPAVYGLILMFVLLTQYGTWILLGVVEEKSSRVIEVLLATLRPRQLLSGKVLGIGIVALAQASLIVGLALGLSAAVGSDLLTGSTPGTVLATLVWLLLGYGFYCWVYAAAGSLANRSEHVQALAFPLQIPILLGYLVSFTALGAGHASVFVQVLAYVPPTAPFAMPVLISLGQATWWEYLVSVAISLLATVGVARVAGYVYLRAILRTGQRVRLRDIRSGQPPVKPGPVSVGHPG
jgi:ABC-2 type transport system permease protein